MKPSRDPIAIIGMGCRYPGAPDLSSFWRILHDAEDALDVPAGRRFSRPVSGVGDLPLAGLGGLLDDIDCFDADFFGVSPQEASCFDPQQRLLLEVSWEAFEDAGLTREKVSGARAGVFVGIWAGDFENSLYASGAGLDVHLITGVGRFPGPNRVSYALDLRGPSIALDTACSSSLVAVHLACQSIWTGESEFALAGGVNAILRPEITEGFMKANMLAADRRCKFGDSSADGFVRSEGAGMIVLKPLSKAMRDGDAVYAVICGGAVNNDGFSNGMLLHPSREGQEQLLRDAYRDACIAPAQVQYVEAHGTGTSAGDPIEIEALGNVLAAPERQDVCRVGSVKTNIGHTEGAAGVAGVIKVALSLWHGEIPASLHFRQPNPRAAWKESALAVQTQTTPWPIGERRIAGVSAFGITGTNAHIVLEGVADRFSRKRRPGSAPNRACLVPITAKCPEALDALAKSYAGHLNQGDNPISDVADVAYTAAQRRTHFDERLVSIVRGPVEFREKINSFLRKEPCPETIWGRRNRNGRGKIAFVFPGQGAQWTGMGRQLFRDEPVFREEIERCQSEMRLLVKWSLLKLFTGSDPLPERIDVLQPALFAMSAALSKLWRHWGVKPDAVVGHSMGEVAAAYVSGALSLADAATVICQRSALLGRVSGQGSMALVELSTASLEQRLAPYGGRISIAASNSASSTVLSGEPNALKELLEELQAEQTFCRFVKVDVASHSAYVDPIRGNLIEALSELAPGRGSIPMYSTVTGNQEYGEQLGANYWMRNLREPVMFGRAIQQLVADGFGTFIEMSPHPLLVPSVQAGFAEAGREGLSLPSLKRDEDERAALLSSAGALFVAGYALDWGSLNGSGSCISLPNYPFRREHLWPSMPSVRRSGDHAFLTQRVELASSPGTWIWDMEIGLGSAPYLADHRIRGVAVFPGAGYLDLALAAGKSAGIETGVIEDVRLQNALLLPEGSTRQVQITISQPLNGGFPFQINAREQDGSWIVLADGRLRRVDDGAPAAEPQTAVRERCPKSVSGEAHYQRLAERGLLYGPSFQLVEKAWHSTRESLVLIRQEKTNAIECSRHVLHPAVIDAALQSVAELMPDGDPLACEATYVPVSIERTRLLRVPEPGVELFAHAVRRAADDDTLCCDITLLDSAGNPMLEIGGFTCRPVDRAESGERCLYELTWGPYPITSTAVNEGAGQWMIFADRHEASTRIASQLEALGYSCVQVHAAEAYASAGARYDINPCVMADYQRLINAAGPCVGVLHLWGLDVDASDNTSLEELAAAQRLGTEGVVLLVRALAESGWSQPPRLWLATAGLHEIDESKQVSFAQSPIVGLARVIACEHPELRCTSVDLSQAPGDDEITLLARTLHTAADADQIVLRGRARYSAQFANLPAPSMQPFSIRTSKSSYCVAIGEPGILGSIGREETQRKHPGPGEVAIKVAGRRTELHRCSEIAWDLPGNRTRELSAVGWRVCRNRPRNRSWRRTRAVRPCRRGRYAFSSQDRIDGFACGGTRRVGGAEASESELGGCGNHTAGFPDRLARPPHTGRNSERRTRPDPCRHRRRRAGRHPIGAASRCDGVRHGRKSRKAAVSQATGSRVRIRFAVHGICR